MTIIKTILQYIFSVPLILFGGVVDPFVDGILEENPDESENSTV